MHPARVVLAGLLACSAASATELVRVRISQFDGSEPAALSSDSHPDLFVLDPSIAFAELVATNPPDPRKEDHGPATWLPELTPAQLLPRQGFPPPVGMIELRIVPAAGTPVAFGALHFRAAALAPGQPSHFRLTGPGLEAAAPGGIAVDLRVATTRTFPLAAAASAESATFLWSAGVFSGGTGGPAGFRDVDLVVSTPLCAPAPRADCVATSRARHRLVSGGRICHLAWSWRAAGADLEPLGGVDAAPLFAWCAYDDNGLRPVPVFGPDLCGERSCWKEGARGFVYRSGDGRLRLRRSARGVTGAVESPWPIYSIPFPGSTPPPPAGAFRNQLVRSDDGTCFESTLALP